ncbi:unnamed protein product [Tenebrio molitor]|nr:unnamed protein product [Tenebrio molitor]
MRFYRYKPLIPDDCVWLLGISLEIFLNRPMNLLLKILFMGCTILTLFQTILFLQKFDAYYFIKYLPMYAGSYFILLSLYSTPHMVNAIKVFADVMDLWKINCSGSKIEKWIKIEGFYLNSLVIFVAIVSYVSAITYSIPLDEDENIFYPLAIFKEFFPRWQNILSWVYRATFILMPLILSTPCYALIYTTSHLRFQFYMLLHFLKRINSGYETSDVNQLIDNRQFQKEVKKRLKFCLKRHAHLFAIFCNMNRELNTLIFLFSVMGGVLGISCMLFFFSFQGSFDGMYTTRLVTLIIPMVLISVHTALAGQLVENTSSETFEILKQADWHCWNSENKKVYLIFLGFAKDMFKIKFSDSMLVNFQLVLTILKWMYSVASVMVQLKYIDYSNH